MLTDAEIVQLRGDKRYDELVRMGLKNVARDLINVGAGDLKPEVSAVLKIGYVFAKARLIRGELAIATSDLLERFLNREMRWSRTPDSVHAICQADHAFLWMRYDLQRVDALFNRARALLTDARYRALLKEYSSFDGDKNERLATLLGELDALAEETKRSITTRGVYDQWFTAQADVFYRQNEKAIQRRILESGRSGALGELPTADEYEKEPK